MLICFDTEFTNLGLSPDLVSIGLVSEDGVHTFYSELSDTYTLPQCSSFVRETVLPLLSGGAALMSMHDLTLRLGSWLDDFEEPVQLATDNAGWDWPFIERIFRTPGTWPENLAREPVLLTVNYLDYFDAFEAAVKEAFAAGGLRQHHALDDARANRLGWLAAGGLCHIATAKS